MNILPTTIFTINEDEFHPAIIIADTTYANKDKVFDAEEAARGYAEAMADHLESELENFLSANGYEETDTQTIDD